MNPTLLSRRDPGERRAPAPPVGRGLAVVDDERVAREALPDDSPENALSLPVRDPHLANPEFARVPEKLVEELWDLFGEESVKVEVVRDDDRVGKPLVEALRPGGRPGGLRGEPSPNETEEGRKKRFFHARPIGER